MPRFVILRHTLPAGAGRSDHYDLMLENDGQLLTWALHQLPNAEQQTAEELPAHRIDYLTYEGPVSDERGEVRRVAEGNFAWLQYDLDTLRVRIESPQATGELCLRRQADKCWSVVLLSASRPVITH